MTLRSRYQGGGIGANVFSSTPAPTCPPGQHWVNDAPTTVLKGLSGAIGACVPNVRPLTFHQPAPPAPPATVNIKPLTFAPAQPPANDAAPAPTDMATAPAPRTIETCPPVWSLWWLVVAFGAGAYAGHLVVKNQKAVKKNAGRIANLAATRAVNAGVARLLG